MNKQELIDKLASLVGSIEDFKGISTFHDGKYAGLEHALELIKQLDEPQKPVVPQFVAEWIEKLRKQIVPYHFESGARFMMFIGGDLHHKKGLILINEEIRQWLEKDGNEVILSDAIDYGYEVEKEPKWVVIVGNFYLKEPLGDTNIDAVQMSQQKNLHISLMIRKQHYYMLNGLVKISQLSRKCRCDLMTTADEPQKVIAHLAEHWDEDMGDVLWWNFPVEEPPYCGTPLDENFPKYKTHFSMIDMPNEIEKQKQWVVKLPNDYYFSSWVSLYSLEADGAAYKFYDDVFVFNDRAKAEAVATLVEGTVEKV